MATTYYNDLQKLYVAYFNRPADPGGLAFWEGIVEKANGNTAAVSAEFAKSPEYKDAFAGQTNEQIVDTIYKNIFGHAADATGKAFYAKALTENRITVDLVVKDIAGGAQGTDLTAFNNKVKAAEAFTTALDTDAEKAGYAGVDALKLAKDFIAGVTTDATYAAAVAPANLNDVIADVVHAGTPFVMGAALAALDAANDALTAFLVTADGDDKASTSATEAQVTGAVTTANTAVGTIVGGTYNDPAQTTGVQAALLADKTAALTKVLGDAETAYAAAVNKAGAAPGLNAALTAVETATTAEKAAVEAQAIATGTATGAETAYESLSSTTITVNPDGTVTGLIVLKDGELVLADKVTETTNKGVTALLNAVTAREAADVAVTAAASETFDAKVAVEVADYESTNAAAVTALKAVGNGITVTADLATDALPTAVQIADERAALVAAVAAAAPADVAAAQKALTDFTKLITDFTAANATKLADAVTAANTTVETAQKDVDTLAEKVADLTEAQALATQMAGLKEAITFAQETFTTNDYKLPVVLGASASATSGSDIFLADDTVVSKVANFGTAGDDVLYVGSGYKLNATGDITKGVNADLEVFFVKSGTSTNVIVETSPFGSNAAGTEYLTITLTGVAPDQLKFDNGIITHV